jgi:hypothetical protein
VHLYNGDLKRNQTAHLAVLTTDVGQRDLQQCADAVIRLWAEYLWAQRLEDQLSFATSAGDALPFKRWMAGERPGFQQDRVVWRKTAAKDGSRATFRRYLDFVFAYAGSSSLERYTLSRVADGKVRPGDVFVQGGFPGHAVIVVDVVTGRMGQPRMMLAQSYMPAQEIHVLDNPNAPGTPWYELERDLPLRTPEWTFPPGSLRRFPSPRP